MASLRYEGLLSLHSWGEADHILFLSSLSDPVAEVLYNNISNKTVTVRYWITEKQCTRDEAQEQFLRNLFGAAECDFGSHYSELTGYLWTDEEVNVGGHDLIQELRGHVGKWLILEVDVHPCKPSADR